jgi:hypothetical protein
VHLFWVTRTKEEFASFESLRVEKSESFKNLLVSVWVTLSNASDIDVEASPPFEEASIPKEGKTDVCPRHHENEPKYEVVWTGFPTWLWTSSVHGRQCHRHSPRRYWLCHVKGKHSLRRRIASRAAIFAGELIHRFDLCRLDGRGLDGIAWRWRALHEAKAVEGNSDKLQQQGVVDTGSDSTGTRSEEEDAVLEEHHDRDPRSSPIVVGTGSRPDIAEIFNTTEAEL